MRIIDQLVYKIIGDTTDIDKALDKIFEKMGAVGKVAKTALGGVTVGSIINAVKKLGDMAIQSTVALDRVDKLSQKIGMSRQGFQEWDFAIAQSGASIEGLQMGMKTLATQADAAAKGTGDSAEMFKKLGVEITDANGKIKDQETLFNEVFLALSDLESETERTAIASRLLGRASTELAPMLNSSKEEIEGLKRQAHDLGLVYEDDLIDAGVRLGDNIMSLQKSFEALKTKALAPIVSTLVIVTDKLLGQDTASGRLKDALDNVRNATDKYKRAQEQAKDSTDTLTQAMLLQAEMAMNQAWTDLVKTYSEAEKEIPRLNDRIAELNNQQRKSLTTSRDLERGWASLTKNTVLAGTTLRDVVADFDRNWDKLQDSLSGTEKEFGYAFDIEQAMIKYKKAMKEQLSIGDQLVNVNGRLKTAQTEISLTEIQLAEMVADGNTEILRRIDYNEKLTASVLKRSEQIKQERAGTQQAINDYEKLSTATRLQVEAEIRRTEASLKQARSAQEIARHRKTLLLLQEDLNKKIAEEIKQQEDLKEKEKLRAELIKDTEQAIKGTVDLHGVLGKSYDKLGAQISIYRMAIEQLRESGLNLQDSRVQRLVASLHELEKQVEDSGKGTEGLAKVTEEYNIAVSNAQARLAVTGDELAYNQQMVSALESALVDLILTNEQNSEQYEELTEKYKRYKQAVKEARDALKDTEDVEKDRAEILKKNNQEMALSVKYAEAFGEEYGLVNSQIGILTDSIKALLATGLEPTDAVVADLIEKLQALYGTTDDGTDEIDKQAEAWDRWVEALLDANYRAMVTGDQQAYLRQAIDATEKAMVDLLKAGLQPSSVEYKRLTERVAELKEELKEVNDETDKSGFALWVAENNEALSKTVEILSEVSSGVRSLGNLFNALTAQRLKQIDDALEAQLRAEGLAEETAVERLQRELDEAIRAGNEEVANEKRNALRKAEIEEDFAEKKKRIQREEAKRQKDLAIFQAIIDTASAIIRAMPNIALMALAGATGALQLATIQAQPLPSFDTGSIRVDKDQVAKVHKGEMILPAGLSDEARKEGITIAPAGGKDIHLQVYLDSRPLVDATVKGINSGQHGRIDARVVK